MKILLVHLCLAPYEIFTLKMFGAIKNTLFNVRCSLKTRQSMTSSAKIWIQHFFFFFRKLIKSSRLDGQKYSNDKIESRGCLMTLLSMTAMALMTRPLMRLSIWQNRKSLQ